MAMIRRPDGIGQVHQPRIVANHQSGIFQQHGGFKQIGLSAEVDHFRLCRLDYPGNLPIVAASQQYHLASGADQRRGQGGVIFSAPAPAVHFLLDVGSPTGGKDHVIVDFSALKKLGGDRRHVGLRNGKLHPEIKAKNAQFPEQSAVMENMVLDAFDGHRLG